MMHFDAGEARWACKRMGYGKSGEMTSSVQEFFASTDQCSRCAMSRPVAKAVLAINDSGERQRRRPGSKVYKRERAMEEGLRLVGQLQPQQPTRETGGDDDVYT